MQGIILGMGPKSTGYSGSFPLEMSIPWYLVDPVVAFWGSMTDDSGLIYIFSGSIWIHREMCIHTHIYIYIWTQNPDIIYPVGSIGGYVYIYIYIDLESRYHPPRVAPQKLFRSLFRWCHLQLVDSIAYWGVAPYRWFIWCSIPNGRFLPRCLVVFQHRVDWNHQSRNWLKGELVMEKHLQPTQWTNMKQHELTRYPWAFRLTRISYMLTWGPTRIHYTCLSDLTGSLRRCQGSEMIWRCVGWYSQGLKNQ